MKIVIIISGASGAKVALKFAKFLSSKNQVHLVITKGAKRALAAESGIKFKDFKRANAQIKYYKNSDLAAKISSGSYQIDAYFAYASASFCAAAAAGLAHNLALRCVQVALKEKRKIILAPREMPMSSILLGALSTLSGCGALIAPPVLGGYAKCSAQEFLIGRWALLLGQKSDKFKIWKGK